MFLGPTKRKKDGKEHRYWSVVENIRPPAGSVHQKTLLYLGELNDSQHAAWTKALEVFNADSGQIETRSLFPADRIPPVSADADGSVAPALALRLEGYHLYRPRQYGACWLATELWRQLGLETFWADKLPSSREGTDWARLLQVSVAYRLIAPGSEWRCHRLWYDHRAMGDLLGPDFRWGGKDQLYQVLDRLLAHRSALFTHLQQRWQDLFGAKYEVLLYDLTSTYVEGQAEEIPKAQFGHSRDHRPDCRQVVIALVVTPEGFPLAYEVMPGNTSDKTTLREFLAKIEQQYGKASRIWIMDRGIPTEEVLAEMRAAQPPVHYLVGINFVGDSAGFLDATDTAGVVPQENFNNIEGGSAAAAALVDAAGNPSPVTLTFNGAVRYNGAGTRTADDALLTGYVQNNNNAMTVTLGGVPAGNYQIIIYSVGFPFQTIYDQAFALTGGGTYPTFHIRAQDGLQYVNNPRFIRMASTDPNNRQVGNYVIFENVSPDGTGTFTLELTPEPPATPGVGDAMPALNALQLVRVVPPAPVLAITRGPSASTIIVSWGGDATGYTLETSRTLGPTASWSALGTAGNPVVGAGAHTNLTLFNAVFYRLRR